MSVITVLRAYHISEVQKQGEKKFLKLTLLRLLFIQLVKSDNYFRFQYFHPCSY